MRWLTAGSAGGQSPAGWWRRWPGRRTGSRAPAADPAVAVPQAAPDDPRPLMPALLVALLEPEQISGLLGRWRYEKDPKYPETPVLRRLTPRTRFVLIGLAVAVLFLCLAALDHALTNPRGVRTAIGLIVNPEPRPERVSLAFLQDPVGLITIVMTLLTPVLFTVQVSAIQRFNPRNEGNIAYRAGSLDCGKINRQVKWVNDRFRLIGSRPGSFLVLLLSAVLSFLINYLIDRWGMFPGWNQTDLTNDAWGRLVYQGWWANPHSHLILAIALWSLGCYFFYFIIKQVTMGAYFALYMHRVTPRQFGVCPNLSANTDGFWGLLPVRRFMQATYSSALGHTIMVLGILVVWLPFSAFTVYMLTLLIAINALVVVYPSMVGYAGAYNEKVLFTAHVLEGHQEPTTEEAAVIERVWGSQTLPFRAGSTLTAVTVYLLFPLLLALVPRLLGS
jgi:hypothetical protein